MSVLGYIVGIYFIYNMGLVFNILVKGRLYHVVTVQGRMAFHGDMMMRRLDTLHRMTR